MITRKDIEEPFFVAYVPHKDIKLHAYLRLESSQEIAITGGQPATVLIREARELLVQEIMHRIYGDLETEIRTLRHMLFGQHEQPVSKDALEQFDVIYGMFAAAKAGESTQRLDGLDAQPDPHRPLPH